MRGRTNLTLRGFAMVLVALGMMSMGGNSVSAQAAPTCSLEAGLSFFDTNADGILSITELQNVASQFPDDAELQALVAQAAGDADFGGIQYRDCDENGGGTTPTPGTGTTPTPGTGTTPTPGTGTTPTPGTGTTPPANGDDDDDDNGDDGGVDQLPDTGTGAADGQNGATLLLVGAGGVLALVGAFALRTRTIA